LLLSCPPYFDQKDLVILKEASGEQLDEVERSHSIMSSASVSNVMSMTATTGKRYISAMQGKDSAESGLLLSVHSNNPASFIAT
jgi:hypothetical protein